MHKIDKLQGMLSNFQSLSTLVPFTWTNTDQQEQQPGDNTAEQPLAVPRQEETGECAQTENTNVEEKMTVPTLHSKTTDQKQQESGRASRSAVHFHFLDLSENRWHLKTDQNDPEVTLRSIFCCPDVHIRAAWSIDKIYSSHNHTQKPPSVKLSPAAHHQNFLTKIHTVFTRQPRGNTHQSQPWNSPWQESDSLCSGPLVSTRLLQLSQICKKCFFLTHIPPHISG